MQQLCSRIVLRPTCVTFRYLLCLFQAPLLDSSSFWLLSAVADTFGVQWLLLGHVTDSYCKFPGTFGSAENTTQGFHNSFPHHELKLSYILLYIKLISKLGAIY